MLRHLRVSVLLFALVSIFGCRTAETSAPGSDVKSVSGGGVPFNGFDATGNQTSCVPPPVNQICSQVFDAGDKFGQDCEAAGGQSFSCGCHSYLCSKNIKGGSTSGFGIDGKQKSCGPMPPNTACTEIFGPGDKFGQDCQAAGGTATQCGCHDFVCSKNIKGGSASGFGIDGKQKSCGPMPPNTVCTEIFGAGDKFGQDCQAAGGIATQCGCHDFVCSKNIKTTSGPQTGFGIDGNAKSCTPPSTPQACSQSFGPGDQFGQDCALAGGTPVACGCHDNLCNIKVVNGWVKGYSRTNTAKSCQPVSPGDLICTAQFTADDAWADKCTAQGAVATVCGCHNYVCSAKVQ